MNAKKKIASLLAIGGLIMTGTTAAHALDYNGEEYGQTTWTSGAHIWVKDSYGDDRFPSARYLYNGGAEEDELANKSGYGTTVHKKAPSPITAIKPCLSRWLRPMECYEDWYY